ncbi:50S ribosomal protein L30 [Candidatus Woesearchaeota archaeon]|nr:50S ribosomal protein L30 [Candidatus Woesearchaeota archaeon]
MAKKKEISKEITDLKKELVDDKVLVGKDVVLKNLKNEKLSKIYLASNCPEKTIADIKYYSDLAKVPIVALKLNNEELGVFCKKHFFISVLGIKK